MEDRDIDAAAAATVSLLLQEVAGNLHGVRLGRSEYRVVAAPTIDVATGVARGTAGDAHRVAVSMAIKNTMSTAVERLAWRGMASFASGRQLTGSRQGPRERRSPN